jgi:hypothetical protein
MSCSFLNLKACGGTGEGPEKFASKVKRIEEKEALRRCDVAELV